MENKATPRYSYYVEMLVIASIILISLYNLSCSAEKLSLWVGLLNIGIGALLPSPNQLNLLHRELNAINTELSASKEKLKTENDKKDEISQSSV